MAIVFEANYQKKLGLPGYSSHQYSVTIRTELADISQVNLESARLYSLLQSSVDQEIQKTGFLPPTLNGQEIPINHANGNGNSSHDQWSCSDKQKSLILKIVDDNRLDKRTVEQLAQERFSKGVKTLNKLEASGLIEELLETYGDKEKQNGHGYRRTNGSRYAKAPPR